MGNFWQGKNVFITGINGFIGGNIAKKLISLGANVTGLYRNDKKDTLLYFEGLNEKVNIIHGDLTDKELLTRIISEEQIEIVYHLGAQVEIGVGLKNPYLTFETNIKGTYSLMEACRLNKDQIKAIIVASTDKSYGAYPKDMMPYREDYPLKPRYPYDVSKACADMIAQSYAFEIYQMPVVVTRFCNIYGPGQLNFSAIIPDACRSALGYSEFIPRGNGLSVRDFIFVDDVVDLYATMAVKLSTDPKSVAGEIFNAGTNTAHTMREIVSKVFMHAKKENELSKIINSMKNKETTGEIDCQFMSFDKVQKYFGWTPKTNIDDGIKLSFEWYKRFFSEK